MNTMEINKNRIKQLQQEYRVIDDVLFVEDTVALSALMALNELNTVDYTIITLYAEEKSYRRVATILNLSVGLIAKEINRIKANLRERMKEIEENEL